MNLTKLSCHIIYISSIKPYWLILMACWKLTINNILSGKPKYSYLQPTNKESRIIMAFQVYNGWEMLSKLISHSAQDTFSLYDIQLLDEDTLTLLYGFKLEAN